MASVSSYCGSLVQKQDPDRFLLSHFAPAQCREALWALFAFNYEIAKTREVVSETQLGLIRLQWWREALDAVYAGGDVPEHEIVQALHRVIQAYDLPQELFETLIYAREFDLEDVLPSGIDGVIHYADYTSTPLMTLVMKVIGDDGELTEPVQAVAVNYALAGLLKATLSFSQQRRCYLPEDLMREHRVSVNRLYELNPDKIKEKSVDGGLNAVVEAVARQFVGGLHCDDRFLKASQHLAQLYMQQLKRLGYDVFHPRWRLPPAFKELRLLLNL